MVWYKVRNKPLVREAFQWDGSEKCLYSHFTPEERESHTLRIVGIGESRFVMLDTLHGPSCCKPNDWIIREDWGGRRGVETYCVKAHVFEQAYEIVGEVRDDTN